MRPFNLEQALKGKPVVTRNGRKVTNIVVDKTDKRYPISAHVFEGDKLFEECPGKYDQGAYDWRNVNGDGFEYAITKGTHGDEFVKLENGEYLRRKIQKHA